MKWKQLACISLGLCAVSLSPSIFAANYCPPDYVAVKFYTDRFPHYASLPNKALDDISQRRVKIGDRKLSHYNFYITHVAAPRCINSPIRPARLLNHNYGNIEWFHCNNPNANMLNHLSKIDLAITQHGQVIYRASCFYNTAKNSQSPDNIISSTTVKLSQCSINLADARQVSDDECH